MSFNAGDRVKVFRNVRKLPGEIDYRNPDYPKIGWEGILEVNCGHTWNMPDEWSIKWINAEAKVQDGNLVHEWMLKPIEKSIKQYGIVKFLEKTCK
jgi:hypothetical protein